MNVREQTHWTDFPKIINKIFRFMRFNFKGWILQHHFFYDLPHHPVFATKFLQNRFWFHKLYIFFQKSSWLSLPSCSFFGFKHLRYLFHGGVCFSFPRNWFDQCPSFKFEIFFIQFTIAFVFPHLTIWLSSFKKESEEHFPKCKTFELKVKIVIVWVTFVE